jgi:hypothetical protein
LNELLGRDTELLQADTHVRLLGSHDQLYKALQSHSRPVPQLGLARTGQNHLARNI